jgi:NTP pyrophosphatase (non-canonical NTP hydrolase)
MTTRSSFGEVHAGVPEDYDFRDNIPELSDVYEELERQWDKWGDQLHDNFKWITILGEEFGEACEAALDHDDDHLYEELVQVAAVAVNFARTLRLRTQDQESSG